MTKGFSYLASGEGVSKVTSLPPPFRGRVAAGVGAGGLAFPPDSGPVDCIADCTACGSPFDVVVSGLTNGGCSPCGTGPDPSDCTTYNSAFTPIKVGGGDSCSWAQSAGSQVEINVNCSAQLWSVLCKNAFDDTNCVTFTRDSDGGCPYYVDWAVASGCCESSGATCTSEA